MEQDLFGWNERHQQEVMKQETKKVIRYKVLRKDKTGKLPKPEFIATYNKNTSQWDFTDNGGNYHEQ